MAWADSLVWTSVLDSAPARRGQINTRLRDAGAAPPLVDYIASVWWGQPAAAWPASVTSAIAT